MVAGRRAMMLRGSSVVALRGWRAVTVALLRGRRTAVAVVTVLRRGPVAVGRARRGTVATVLALLVAGGRARGRSVVVVAIAILLVVLRWRTAVALPHARRYEEAAVFAHDGWLCICKYSGAVPTLAW